MDHFIRKIGDYEQMQKLIVNDTQGAVEIFYFVVAMDK